MAFTNSKRILELSSQGYSQREISRIVGRSLGHINGVLQSNGIRRQEQQTLVAAPTTTAFDIDKLKGLDFARWNEVIGLPVQKKPGLPQQFPFPYEWTVFNELFKEEGSPKDRHVAWLASRGIGKSETAIRILAWLATKDDNLKGSEMMLITGNRQALSNDLCSRIKFLFKDANLPDTAANVVELNGVHIEGYPASGHTSAGRGKSFVSAIFLDESSWWNPHETQGILDVIQGYWVKSNPYCLFASSPSQPSDLMDQIWQQPEDECAWRRLKMDWRYGENLIYSQADLARIRGSSSWKREMELGWSPKSGSTFLQSDIERAKSIEYDISPLYGNERTIAVDPASGTTGIVVTEARDGDIYVLKAEEVTRAMHETLADHVYELWHEYGPISKLYIDNSAVTFVKTMRGILGEPIDYMTQIKELKAAHAKYELNMVCEPVFFTLQNKREMLGLLKQVLEEGHLRIHPSFDKLLLFLHSCTDTELVVDKLSTPHDDIGDALMMNLRNYSK